MLSCLSACLPLTDIRMSKPVEVEKVGADSPLEGTGKMCCCWWQKAQKLHVFILYKKWYIHDAVCVSCLCICAQTHYQFLTFSFPSHADSERNGPESNHQVHLTPVIITFIFHLFHLRDWCTNRDNSATQIFVGLINSIIDWFVHSFSFNLQMKPKPKLSRLLVLLWQC